MTPASFALAPGVDCHCIRCHREQSADLDELKAAGAKVKRTLREGRSSFFGIDAPNLPCDGCRGTRYVLRFTT